MQLFVYAIGFEKGENMIKIESRLALRSYEEKTDAQIHLQVDARSNEQICAEIVGILTTLEKKFPVELSVAIEAILKGVVEDENS